MKHQINYNDYLEKIYAGWMGKSIGGTIGAPMENHKVRMNFTHDELWPKTIMPNDDLDLQIVWLEALQELGIWLESDDLAKFWQGRSWYNFCEYGVFLNNFQRGIHPPLSGTWNNRFYFESEGCPIRSEIWGLVCPGNPVLAADYARKDAQLDHGGASVLCEMFLAAAEAAAFFDNDLDRVLDTGLSVLPMESEVHRMVNETRSICAAHPRFEDAWRLVVRRFGDRDASKAIMNQAIVVMVLILGNGDFAETIRLAINSGWDTDCTAATAGALLGIMHGKSIFPSDWVEKMGKNLACDVNVKHRTASFDELTDDTARLGVEIAHLRNRHIEILNAPEVALRPQPELGIKLGVTYPSGPVVSPGQNTPVSLNFSNTSNKTLSGTWRLEAPKQFICSCTNGNITLVPGESAAIELLVYLPESGPVWDKNLLNLHWDGADGQTQAYCFGLSGARLWRIYGPYFDMWDTSKNENCPYNHNGIFKMPGNGDGANNHVRLDKPYLDETRLLRADIPEELPEEIYAGEDYLDGTQIAGFHGQACFYLVRELVAKEPCDIDFHITSNAPLVIWFDGKELDRRENGREVSPQDGLIESVNIGPIPKRLVIKLARQSDFLSFCAVAMREERGDPTHKRGISIFADNLGDLPINLQQTIICLKYTKIKKHGMIMKLSQEVYRDKVFGCWAGKCLAGAIGMPFEGVPYQPDLKVENINIQDVPNDDLELQLVWLVALEKHGLDLSLEHLAKYWVEDIKYGVDEYSMAIRNIKRGIMPPASGWEDNFFHDGMGGAIRSEIWAAVFPGRPDAAGYFAANDAMVDHWGDGVWSEVFLAKAESYLFTDCDMVKALKFSLEELPQSSRLAKAICRVFEIYEQGIDADEAKILITREFYHHNFTDCVMNLTFMVFALLWGKGDFIKTLLLAINCGRDTDCTAATCGSFLGICYGSKVIPADLLEKLSPDLVISEYISKIAGLPVTLPDLIERTVALKEKLGKELSETLYPIYQPFVPGEPAAFDKARWLILDEKQHDIALIKEKLLSDGKCPEELKEHIIETKGLTFDLSRHANRANTLNLFTFLEVDNTDTASEDVVISATADVGMTLWLDKNRLFNHHSRQLSIPSFHRAEGGAAFNYPLRHRDHKLVHIKLYSCLSPLNCTLMFGDNFNDHLEGFKLSI